MEGEHAPLNTQQPRAIEDLGFGLCSESSRAGIIFHIQGECPSHKIDPQSFLIFFSSVYKAEEVCDTCLCCIYTSCALEAPGLHLDLMFE